MYNRTVVTHLLDCRQRGTWVLISAHVGQRPGEVTQVTDLQILKV